MNNEKCQLEAAATSNIEKVTLNVQAPESQQLTQATPRPASGHLLPRAEKERSTERRLSGMDAEPFITKETVAERICVTPETVRRWASDGRLPSHHFGRRLRFLWSEVQQALMNQK